MITEGIYGYRRLRQCRSDADNGPSEIAHRLRWRTAVEVIRHDAVAPESFRAGMSYRTLVGDDRGSTPLRVGIQTSSPGYKTLLHSHPYMEVITVLDGRGEAWVDGHDNLIELTPGITLV